MEEIKKLAMPAWVYHIKLFAVLIILQDKGCSTTHRESTNKLGGLYLLSSIHTRLRIGNWFRQLRV